MPSKRYRNMDYLPNFLILENQVIHSKIHKSSRNTDDIDENLR